MAEGSTAEDNPLLESGGYFHRARPIPYPAGIKEKHGNMRRGVHLAIGLLAFCFYAYLGHFLQDIPREALVFGLLAAFTGSILPDLLERPTSLRHRGFFHSKRVLKGTSMLFLSTVALWLLPEVPLKTVVFGLSAFALGYLLHLAADSMTKRGLPG